MRPTLEALESRDCPSVLHGGRGHDLIRVHQPEHHAHVKVVHAMADPSQTNAPTAYAQDSSVGTAWSHPENALAADGQYATHVSGPSQPNSYYLVLTGFNFSIPDGATITGITVNIYGYANRAVVHDNSIRPVVGGVIAGNELATTDLWPTTPTLMVRGGDTLGINPTPAMVNDPGFGVAISVGGAAVVAERIDYVTITVEYT